MKSTSGLSIWPRNCRAYAESDSTYRRWPSAKIVSKASEDFPEPDRPVKTISWSRGRSRSTLRKLCSVSYTHLRAHETRHDLVCRLLLEKKKSRADFPSA